MAQKKTPKEPERLSLHGMTPEEAIKKVFGTPPPTPAKKPARRSGGKSAKK